MSARSYYNENDPFAAQWLRNLIQEGLIAAGDVDERSIEDVNPKDLKGYTQCHFFVGIGGWSFALRLSGWPDDRPVWTGSCPCQPFSAAGARKGTDDPRHLWPHWRWLIDQCRPPIIFGEQVASKDGRLWLAGVRSDLEALGYAVGAADLCAAGVGAPHIRQRLYWMADAGSRGRAPRAVCKRGCSDEGRSRPAATDCSGMGNADDAGSQGRGVLPERADELSPWAASLDNWLPCADGKARRIEPGIEPLAHGVSGRVAVVRPGFEGRAEDSEALHWYSRRGALEGFGNAIVPQVAATFIEAFLGRECSHR